MAQPTALMPEGRQRYFNNDGTPAAGGLLYTYAAGTSALKATYSDADGTTPNPNPLTLDAHGEATIFWTGSYKVDLKQADGQQVSGYPVDNLRTDPASTWTAAATLQGLLAAAAGAGMIGYAAAAAGAVQMWASEKLAERVSVRDYMTPQQRTNVFNHVGTQDVSGAIQKAIDSLGTNGGEVIFPPGTYLAGSTVTISNKPNVHLRGTKHGGSWTTSTLGSTIKANANTLDVFEFNSYSYNVVVEGLHITGGKRALHFDTCLGWHVYNVNLRENQIGIEAYGNGVAVIRDCMIRDNTDKGIYLAKSSGDTDIFSCDVGNNKINLLISTGGVRVFGGSFFSSKYAGAGVGIQIDTTSTSHDTIIRNVKIFGCLIANNDTQIKILGTSLAERDIQDVEFIGCHIHQADDGGETFDATFPYGQGAYVANVLKGVRFLDCDFIGCRDYALKAVNCYDGITVRGGSMRNCNADAIVFDLVQWGRVMDVDFIGNGGTALKMLCSNLGDYTQNNRFEKCNFRSGGAFYSEDARTRANFHTDHFGPNLGSFALNNVAPLTQICNPAQAGNQLSLKNQTLYLDGAAWNSSRLILGSYNFWVDGTGRLRIKSSPPTSDTDGTVVGTQA